MNLKGLSRLAFELGVRVETLRMLCVDPERWYHERLVLKTYDDGSPKLINGEPTFRTIVESRGILKKVQTRITQTYLSPLEWPDHVHGGIRERSNKTNARSHVGKRFHFLTDIRDFFPSVRHHMVYRVWTNMGFAPDAARILTRVTTRRGSLPQGVPSSPHLANLVFLDADQALLAITHRFDLTYTRFVDDLVFSSNEPFQEAIPEIIGVIGRAGFRVANRGKTYYKIGGVEITGVYTANNLQAPERLKARLERMNPDTPGFEGLKQYINHIER